MHKDAFIDEGAQGISVTVDLSALFLLVTKITLILANAVFKTRDTVSVEHL